MPSSNMDLDQMARTKLPEAANALAQAIRTKAPTRRIKGAVSVKDVVSPRQGIYQIDVVISLKDAPEAAAYEWGSGIHRTVGAKQHYKIRPKNASRLAFKWENPEETVITHDKYLGQGKDGKKYFSYVDHPGVAAKPYIVPSIEEKTPEIRQILGTAFAIGVKSALVEFFKDVV